MSAIGAGTLQVETNTLNILCAQVKLDGVEYLENYFVVLILVNLGFKEIIMDHCVKNCY